MDNWNDDRLDERFIAEMREGFGQVATNRELRELRGDVQRIADKVDRLQAMVIGGCIGLIAIMLTGFILT